MGIAVKPEITEDLFTRFGIVIEDAQPITGGYLNEKWRARTNLGDLLIKKFSARRYPDSRLKGVRHALIWQNEACQQGIPCPGIITHQGEPIQRLNDGTAYTAMPFLPGVQLTPETVTAAQMESLGEVCGRMHRAFSDLPLDGIPFRCESSIDQFRQKMRDIVAALSPDDSTPYTNAVRCSVEIAEDLNGAFLDSFTKGIAHSDFAIDNILFQGDRLSAVLDFDTVAYNYPHRDIGRALLSFALIGDRFQCDRVHALNRGYARSMKALSPREMADAVRLIGYSELSTWLRPDMRSETRGKVVRFHRESIWLVEHWRDLEDLLQ